MEILNQTPQFHSPSSHSLYAPHSSSSHPQRILLKLTKYKIKQTKIPPYSSIFTVSSTTLHLIEWHWQLLYVMLVTFLSNSPTHISFLLWVTGLGQGLLHTIITGPSLKRLLNPAVALSHGYPAAVLHSTNLFTCQQVMDGVDC